MSTREKLFARLTARPTPIDFTWDELVTLFKQHDFTVTSSGTSHHTFQHARTGLTFKASKPHPANAIKIYQVRAALEALTAVRESAT
jgi:HicA toxin of bacterial toxin-antitoxin,